MKSKMNNPVFIKSFLVFGILSVLQGCVASQPLTAEQRQARAEEEIVTGSRIPAKSAPAQPVTIVTRKDAEQNMIRTGPGPRIN
jgi:outer membrane cobalamin receptor